MRTEQTERTSKVIGNALVACLGEVKEVLENFPKHTCIEDESTGCCGGCGVEMSRCDLCEGIGYHFAACPLNEGQGQALYFGLEVKVIEMLNVWASVERNGNRFVVLCEDLKPVEVQS